MCCFLCARELFCDVSCVSLNFTVQCYKSLVVAMSFDVESILLKLLAIEVAGEKLEILILMDF